MKVRVLTGYEEQEFAGELEAALWLAERLDAETIYWLRTDGLRRVQQAAAGKRPPEAESTPKPE